MFKKLNRPAFSLIELSIFVLIVGILLIAIFKASRTVLDKYKLQETAVQILNILSEKSENVDAISPKIGGKFLIEHRDRKSFLVLAKDLETGFLSPKQAISLKQLIADSDKTTIRGCNVQENTGLCSIAFEYDNPS